MQNEDTKGITNWNTVLAVSIIKSSARAERGKSLFTFWSK